MVALPFCRVRLQGQKPRDKAYPKEVRTVGDAIRARRLDLGLRQIEVAELLGCNELTILNWEKGHTCPRRKKYSAIRKFLGPWAKQWLVWLEV